ncbi:MAG: nitroreductase family protein [Paludibacteraceae bacterium]|nr:nitroreductase family protein [Paludibacteraceae bacterium]
MNFFELVKYRRSIRKYEDTQIRCEDLEHIIEAGSFAPNAGGGQRSMIVAIRDREISDKLGKLNVASLRRDHLIGGNVSAEQPSIIDDPTIKSGFYGAPTVVVVFAQHNFLYSVPDAFCCAENMVLAATELGISSCIIARAEETFYNDYGKALMAQWNVPENYAPRCFVLLGYCKGEYPKEKPRKENRTLIVE